MAVRKLWNRDFTLLWQGQLVSELGNVAFSIALGFWVLEMTKTATMPNGDLAQMGIVEACFALPAILLGPFAGTIVDRYNRKWILVAADGIRGLIFTAIGAMALFKVFPFWAIYPMAVAAGACGAFFAPAVSSSLPDIVPLELLARANSARGLSSTTAQLVGNSLGGVLYALLTAPLMILWNGISYLYAAAAQLFIRIPPHQAPQQSHVLGDMIDGIKYTFRHKGIRALIVTNMVIGFFSAIILTLLTPLFKSTPGFGVEQFGFVMATMMAGAITGMLASSTVKLRRSHRAAVFCTCQLAIGAAAIFFGIIRNVAWLYPLAFFIGACNAVIGILLQTVLQSAVPRENRGKVFGILGTVSGALHPVAMASSGVVASFAGLRPTFIGACCVLLAASVPFVLSRHFREFMNSEFEADHAEQACGQQPTASVEEQAQT